MTGYTTGPAPHLDDDDLLRLLDDAGDSAWQAERERHLDMCEQCAHDLERLAADDTLVRQWLGAAAFEADLPAPPRRHSQRDAAVVHVTPITAARPAQRRRARPFWPQSAWLRAAAVLLMIAAPVAALPQLRGWIADALTGTATPADVRTFAEPPGADAAAVVRFVPLPGVFVVSLDAPQRDGVLHIRRAATGTEAVLETHPVAGTPATEPVFSEASLRLRNSPASMESYTLVVPPGVSRVTVTMAGATIAELDGAALGAGSAVPLRLR